MKSTLSFLLITLGAVGASIGVARTDTSVEGWVSAFQIHVPLTAISLVILAVGVAVKMQGDRAARKAEAAHGGSLSSLRAAAQQMVAAVQSLEKELGGMDVDTLHARIDAVVTGPVSDFIDNRDAISNTFGLTQYAAVMTEFAPAERYLNRAWSASTDGYLDEATTYVRRAAPALVAADKRLASLT